LRHGLSPLPAIETKPPACTLLSSIGRINAPPYLPNLQ
jgi:hypothetical protein